MAEKEQYTEQSKKLTPSQLEALLQTSGAVEVMQSLHNQIWKEHMGVGDVIEHESFLPIKLQPSLEFSMETSPYEDEDESVRAGVDGTQTPYAMISLYYNGRPVDQQMNDRDFAHMHDFLRVIAYPTGDLGVVLGQDYFADQFTSGEKFVAQATLGPQAIDRETVEKVIRNMLAEVPPVASQTHTLRRVA